jgi:hypothetical protein
MNLKKLLPTLLAVACVIFLAAAILLFAVAVPRADLPYKSILSVICAILLLILAGLCAWYVWLSRDNYPNFFLWDRRAKRNIPVDKLKFGRVSECMSFLICQLADTPEELWKGEVLLHEDDKFGYRSVYKPLVAYKMLYDLGEQSADSAYWNFFREAPAANINAICEVLERAGEKKMVQAFRLIIEKNPKDNAKIKEFLSRNLGYIRSKMVKYVVKHIELFY